MSIQRKISNFLFLLVTGLLGIALIVNGRTICAQSPSQPTKNVTSDSTFDALAEEYQQWRDFSFPESAIARGRPTSPDRITEPGIRGALNRHNEIGYLIEKIASIDRAQLNAVNQLDYDLLNRDLRNDFDSFRFMRWMMHVGQRGGPQQDLPQFAESVPFRQAADWENYVKRMTRLGAAVRDTQSMMEQGLEEGIVPPATVLEGVVGQFEAVLRGNLNEIDVPLAHMPDSIPEEQQQSLREQAKTAKLDALLALGEMLAWLKETYIPKGLKSISVKDQYLGAEYYAFELKRFTTTDLTPEEIHRIGLDEVARIRGEMFEVIARTDWFAGDPARAKLSNDDRFNAFVIFCAPIRASITHRRNLCLRVIAMSASALMRSFLSTLESYRAFHTACAKSPASWRHRRQLRITNLAV